MNTADAPRRRQNVITLVRRLVSGGVTLAKLDDGSYVDAWIWEDRSFCEAAMAKVETVPVVVDWLQHIGEDVSMEFGTVVEADQR